MDSRHAFSTSVLPVIDSSIWCTTGPAPHSVATLLLAPACCCLIGLVDRLHRIDLSARSAVGRRALAAGARLGWMA